MGAKSALKPNPPATNRGVEKQVSVSIDWISVTFKDSKKLSYPQECLQEKTECRPFNGYNLAARYSDGRLELTHTTRKEMGTHCVLSGETLKSIPVSPEHILRHFIQHGGVVTRLDIAIDCKNMGLRPQDATERIKSNDVRTRARQFPLWFDPTTAGYTQYIGKKSSSAFVRIYNKAAEVGVDGEWTRVECSFGSARAMDAAQKLLQGADYRALVRGFVDFDKWPEWTAIMSAVPVQTTYTHSLSHTKRWLLSAAAPSLARECYLDGDDEFYFRFVDILRFHLDKLRGEIEQETA